MIKVFITSARVSAGYNGGEAVTFSGDNNSFAKFRIGVKIYDKNAEGNNRWLNYNVKAFGPIAERVGRMKLAAGSHINVVGRFDEDSWTDKETGESRTAPVIYLEEIEYCFLPRETANDSGAPSHNQEQQPARKAGSSRFVPPAVKKPSPSTAKPQQDSSSHTSSAQPEPASDEQPEVGFTGAENYDSGLGSFYDD